MKKLLFCLTVVGLLAFALGGTAVAQSPTLTSFAATVVGAGSGTFAPDWVAAADPINPTVSAIDPVSARDDTDTSVTITGTDFVATPTVSLGSTALTNVVFVDSSTLTATVPGGITPGVYSISVVNPDNGSGTLADAFTVTPLNPTVSAIAPVTGTNDIDTSVTITGSDFAANPTVMLGTTALTNVAVVSSTTLTATVPWGINPGTYGLTVVNPDGGNTLPSAFTVGAGIGQWNPGDLFGGQMQQLLMKPRDPMKPGDPITLYATAYGVMGLFRSTDAGDHWTFVSDQPLVNNNNIAVDPLHPDWLYVFTPSEGLKRSQDDGDTWTTLMPGTWPDGRVLQAYPQVYVSPYEDATHPQALFVSSCEGYVDPEPAGPKGLIKSTDGGLHWTIVQDLEGVPVQAIAFDPNDHSHMVLVTSDMGVYTSSDWGDTWTEIATSGLTLSSLGMGGSITYNPGGSEVWINAPPQQGDGGIFKSAATDLTSWQDVSPLPGYGSWFVSFTSAGSVYVSRFHSSNGGTRWDPFGPSPWYGGQADCIFDPTDPQTAYITNDAVGVQKTTDGGANWEPKVQGLTALSCSSMAVSPTDPLRVYAAFYGPLGIYRSLDGTRTWTFRPIPGASQLRRVLVDPFDSQRVYAGADTGFYTSIDGGDNWTGTGWNLPPSSPSGLLVDMQADPYQAGHLLACLGGYAVPRLLYSSTNYGASWQAVDVNLGLGEQMPHCIAFDPATPGTVYLTATGVYKSTDSGATWQRIDDPKQPGMATTGDITIATHPQHMVAVEASGQLYRSVDDGATWQKADSTEYGGVDVFVDGDSTRLYRATGQGLFFSSDTGDTWERAAGVIGQVQTTALGYTDANGHTILYAATNGGSAATTTGSASRTGRAARATASTLVDAGIYRYAQVTGRATACALTKKSATIGYGAKITIAGTLRDSAMGVRGCSVQLQSSSDGKTFKNTGTPCTTAAGGAFTFTVAPTTKTYYRVHFAGSGNYYVAATSVAISFTPRVYLSAPTAPSTAYRSRAFTSVAYLKPRHAAGTYPVKLQCYRKERQHNGTYKWVLRKTVLAKAANYSTYTKVSARASLPYAGKWFIRAYHAADAKNAATYSSNRYLSVR